MHFVSWHYQVEQSSNEWLSSIIYYEIIIYRPSLGYGWLPKFEPRSFFFNCLFFVCLPKQGVTRITGPFSIPPGGGGGTSIWNGYRWKAETSKHRGIRWERRKKWGASGESRSKWAKIIKIFLNFATFRWKLLQIWRKNKFSLRKISKIGRHLASTFQFFLKKWEFWVTAHTFVKKYRVFGWDCKRPYGVFGWGQC